MVLIGLQLPGASPCYTRGSWQPAPRLGSHAKPRNASREGPAKLTRFNAWII